MKKLAMSIVSVAVFTMLFMSVTPLSDVAGKNYDEPRPTSYNPDI